VSGDNTQAVSRLTGYLNLIKSAGILLTTVIGIMYTVDKRLSAVEGEIKASQVTIEFMLETDHQVWARLWPNDWKLKEMSLKKREFQEAVGD